MNYDFECPSCKHKEVISMPIKEYRAEGWYCPCCSTEMQREISSLVCGMAIDKTGDFYKSTSI